MINKGAKILAITLGDPHSINIHAIATLLPPLLRLPLPIVLIGSHYHWRQQLKLLNIAFTKLPVVAHGDEITGNGCFFWDILAGEETTSADLLSDEARGSIAVRALYALEGLRHYETIAVLTCPIDKSACAKAGFAYPGHTEYFCAKWGRDEGIMILAGPRLRVGLVTNHVAINRLAGLLTIELVATKLALFASSLRDLFGIATPRIAVCGFNPHCSDHGLFGHEDEAILVPALERFLDQAQKQVIVHGLIPADTAFYKGYHGDYDGVLAMYHDQGLAPLKTVHFDDAVNITGGLDIFRVSPDHGPARDLYLKQTPSMVSFRTALEFCVRYLDQKSPES